ncbi:hypothetical protein [Streptomyces sp. NBC_00239]|uniref:hypothetical protein n=1 Tax=Streptomyces sp. NBC_00239 TaxID=2903640 RepID=UPI002E2881F3|nr:hypothetical protein [Streptomyces sp. NBC_00239]
MTAAIVAGLVLTGNGAATATTSSTTGRTTSAQIPEAATVQVAADCPSISTSQPTVGRNRDGRLEAFAQNELDDRIWHVWQTSPNGAWSCWLPFDGGGFHYERSIAVGTDVDGLLEIFAVKLDGSIKRRFQTGNGTWSDWYDLQGTFKGSPRVASNADGRLELFAIGTDSKLYHSWQGSPNGVWWSGWQPIDHNGRLFNLERSQPSVAVGRNEDGRLEVFGLGMDNGIYRIAQDSPNGPWTTGWYGMPGIQGNEQKLVEVASNADGRLELFAVDKNDAGWHIYQTAPNGSWSNWSRLTGDNALGSAIGVGRNSDGRLEAFAAGPIEYGGPGGSRRYVWHTYQNAPNSDWSGWTKIGGSSANAPVVANNADGRLEIFTEMPGPRGYPFHAWQDPNGTFGWSQFYDLGY